MSPKTLKYTKEEMQGFLKYAEDNKIGIMKTLEHFGINRRTFYLTAYRLGLITRKKDIYNDRTMSKEMVDGVLEFAEANRVSHRKACEHFNYSYTTFRGAVIRWGVKAERFSSTLSKEDVQSVFDYAKANHISLMKASKHFGFKYHLISSTAKKYEIVMSREIPVFEEAKAMSDKEVVKFYLEKGYVANEIYHAMQAMDKKISRGMVYYFSQQQSQERIQAKIDKLEEQIGQLKVGQVQKLSTRDVVTQ